MNKAENMWFIHLYFFLRNFTSHIIEAKELQSEWNGLVGPVAIVVVVVVLARNKVQTNYTGV
jgi:hypothetical protein